MNRDELIEHMAKHIRSSHGWPASAPLSMSTEAAEDALAAIEEAGAVVVPKEAINWLNGIGDDFERPANARGAFWWRVEFCRRAQLRMNADGTIAGTLADPPYAEKNNDTR